jgi:diguanylate cyclase (GGDEF)-like protein
MSALAPIDTRVAELDVLLIEDSAPDVDLAIRRLEQGGFRCRQRVVTREIDLRRALEERKPNFILSDFSLPGFDGMAALRIATEVAPEVPFIFLSGTIGEERAIEALRKGAVDYVLKSNPQRLVPAVQRALAEANLRKINRIGERRVARLTDVMQMLSGINTAVVRIQDRSELLSETCRLAHKVGGYPLAMIAVVDPGTCRVGAVATAGIHVQLPAVRGSSATDSENTDRSIIERVVRSGMTFVCDDLAESAIADRDVLLGSGIRSLACLPLQVDATPVGAFLFGAVEAGLMGPDELLLLHEVAANLSFALQYLNKQHAVHFLSYFDPLTGLAKRALFCERLSRMLMRGEQRLPRMAVKVFDIDDLSVVNDAFGRHVGDRLLQCVAERLKVHIQDTERLAHLGGGTFVNVTALGGDSGEEVHSLHQDVQRLFEPPFVIEGHEISVTMKCGIACYPDNGREPNELVQNAEAALKEAKTSGERYLHHRLEMNSALAQRVGMRHRLRAAVENAQFVLHYQPKIQMRTGKIEAAEALLRWNDPEKGLVSPGAFLPMLQSAGLMQAVTAWVVKQAAADCRDWQRAGLPPARIAVNISPPELRRRGFVEEVLEVVGSQACSDEWGIDIEVTEGALHGDSASCVHALRLLRTAGIRIAIDDFGTGYSSLGRLAELPIDSLKIDRIFTSRLPGDRRNCTLVATIIELAHAFDMTTVAEGVETQAQFDALARLGCDESQGFLHSRAISKSEFERLLVTINSAATLRARCPDRPS